MCPAALQVRLSLRTLQALFAGKLWFLANDISRLADSASRELSALALQVLTKQNDKCTIMGCPPKGTSRIDPHARLLLPRVLCFTSSFLVGVISFFLLQGFYGWRSQGSNIWGTVQPCICTQLMLFHMSFCVLQGVFGWRSLDLQYLGRRPSLHLYAAN